jgi:hypothetical protein
VIVGLTVLLAALVLAALVLAAPAVADRAFSLGSRRTRVATSR